jgi:hypothetical protein
LLEDTAWRAGSVCRLRIPETPAFVVPDNFVSWETALAELVASSALLEKLEERSDAGSPQLLEAAQTAHGRLLNALANVGPSTES